VARRGGATPSRQPIHTVNARRHTARRGRPAAGPLALGGELGVDGAPMVRGVGDRRGVVRGRFDGDFFAALAVFGRLRRREERRERSVSLPWQGS